MPDLSVARLEYCAIHHVGNKQNDEGMNLSKGLTPVEHQGLKQVLLRFFLSSFKEDEIHQFTHHTELGMNEVYQYCRRLFEDPESLLLRSVEIAEHLYESTVHPGVPGGELCVAYFEDCYIDGFTSPAIGIFKTESKERYLQFAEVDGTWLAGFDDGISIRKPDKACLVFQQEPENGFKVLVIENNKTGDTQYWREKFLGVRPVADAYHFTSNVLKMTRDFITKEAPAEFPVTRTESIDILNRSLDYFKSHDTFDREEFASSVFEDDRMADSFKKFDTEYHKYNELPETGSFDIDPRAVKKQQKIFKSVLKLDRNFHIYIHGNREMIEKGTDPDGRKFYKIYFEEEQ